MKINKIVRIALSGGLIGLILTNPRKALDNMIEKNNNDGWNAIYYTTHFMDIWCGIFNSI